MEIRNQDLNLWIREVEDVCREIMEDPDAAVEDGRRGSNVYEVNT
jgi:hypothetical protein